MNDLSNILTWKRHLGLLPILLKPNNKDSDYLMLNGGNGDFCLQLSGDKKNDQDYFSIAWSCNTRYFLVVDEENVTFYDWTNSSSKKISQKSILDDFEGFYENYLSKKTSSSSQIVPYINDIFRQFRNITQEKTNPVEALQLLFTLLISLEDDISTIDVQKWNISSIKIPSEFDSFLSKIKTVSQNIKPILKYILRYSSGELFQETQKEITFFDAQRDLFGNISTTQESNSEIHHTPSYLTTSIVENVLAHLDLSKQKIKIFDPVCNSSEYLLEILKQLKQLNYKGQIEIIGFDTRQATVNTSSFLLAYEQRNYWKSKLEFSIKLVDDALKESWDSDFDVILMNPPYISWDLLNDTERNRLRQTLGYNFKGQPNLASAYIYKATKHLNNNGIMGSVIPSSILTLDSYKNLRDEIYYNIAIKVIAKLGNYVFENKHSDVSLFIGKKEKTFEIPTFIWTTNKFGVPQKSLQSLRKMMYLDETNVDEKDFSIFSPDKFPLINDSWKPISLKDNKFLTSIEKLISNGNLVKIDSVFDVKQGIRQGAKNIFKLSANSFRRLPENEKKYFRPVIDNDAIKNGGLFEKHFIWYPYDKDGVLFKYEDELIESVNYFYKITLKPNKKILEDRNGIDEWWGLSRPRHWQFVKSPRLYSTEFGKSDSFAFDTSGEYVAERGNAWIPMDTFSDSDHYFYLALFSSDFFNELLAIYAKQLLSGWDLGKKYTKNIPIPDVHSIEVKTSNGYLKLVEIGKALSTGNAKPKLKAVLNTILVDSFYPKL